MMEHHSTPETINNKLVEIAFDLALTLDMEVLLRKVISLAVELTAAEESSLLLYDEQKRELFFQTSTHPHLQSAMRGMVIPQESLAGWVASNRQSLNVPDVQNDLRHHKWMEKNIQFRTVSALLVPMIARNKLVGVLQVVNKREGIFTQQDQEVMVILAGQAAIAIENTHLFHQSDMIAELVHELRTPLSSICTITYMLRRPNLPEEQRLSLIRTIETEALRLNEMAGSFLNLARLESGRSEFRYSLFSAQELLNECSALITPQANQKGLEVTVNTGQESLVMQADRDQIKQVLLNLLNNAVKYNRENGKITLSAREESERIFFKVEDSGIGIPPEAITRLFSKFYRVQAEGRSISGTGLGLSICKKIVESHGGEITVASQPDKGSTFTFWIPINLSGSERPPRGQR